jgi:hypothetical protein
MVVIPYCNFVTWGLCVRDRVQGELKASVQKGVGKTGESYEEFRAVVKTHLPEFMIIENLKELLVKVDGFDKSDAEYIEGDLLLLGYWCKGFEVFAEDYSSKTSRGRTLFGCVLETTRSRTRERYVENTLRILKLPPHSIEEFLCDKSHLLRCRKKQRNLMDPVYQDVHAQYFMRQNLQWPPPRSAIENCAGLGDYITFINPRPMEVSYYCAKVFPYDKALSDASGYQYMDINMSLERQTGDMGDKSPWNAKLGTITTKTSWLVRFQVKGIDPERNDAIQHKVLDGAELLQLIGYDQTFTDLSFAEELESADGQLLAGNAFNCFAMTAFQIALFSSVRQRSEALPEIAGGDSESPPGSPRSSSSSVSSG